MFKTFRNYLQYQFHHPNYLFFLMSLVFFILIPPYATIFESGLLLLNITFGMVILMAVFYTTSSYREFWSHGALGLVLFLSFLLNRNEETTISYWTPIIMFSFFLLAFKNIIYHIFHVKEIGLNEVYASVAGYLVLGIMVTPFFFLLQQTITNAFNAPEDAQFYDFLYFSYITLTTVGFGDIAPVNHIAKSFTIIVSVFGQLYLTILVAIIIGKYLAFESRRKG